MSAQTAVYEPNPNRQQVALGFGDLYANLGDHIGHFYETPAQGQRTLLDFFAAGLDAGDKCAYMNPGSTEDLVAGLAERGMPARDAIESGQLVVSEGLRSADAMQGMLESCLADIPARFGALRWVGEMTWTLDKLPTTEKLMEWETRCNVLPDVPAVFLCQYDLKVFRGDVILEAMKTHPVCIVGNVIHRNPFYLEPADYLEGLANRRSDY